MRTSSLRQLKFMSIGHVTDKVPRKAQGCVKCHFSKSFMLLKELQALCSAFVALEREFKLMLPTFGQFLCVHYKPQMWIFFFFQLLQLNNATQVEGRGWGEWKETHLNTN